MGNVVLSGRGRRWVERGHPWVYADDVASGEGEPGELLPVSDPSGATLGWGLFSSASKIAVRMVSRGGAQPKRVDWVERLSQAVARRERMGLLAPGAACRLLSGDAEGVPGLVVDRYAHVLLLKSGCQGADRMRDFLLEVLIEVLPFEPRAVLDRSDMAVRRLEELPSRVEWVRGDAVESVVVSEPAVHGDPGLTYVVDPVGGHKTGHYLDQRENRRLAAREVTAGGRVLDAFSYDGLFGIRCAVAGADSVLCLDQAGACEERLRENAERNGVGDRVRFERANAMHDLRDRSRESERFELVVVDPPAFARNKSEVEGAERGYRELNRRAFSLVEPGGLLVSASCSYGVRREAFVRLLGQAAQSAGRDAWLVECRGAAPDHPVHLNVPETDYLKCAFVRL